MLPRQWIQRMVHTATLFKDSSNLIQSHTTSLIRLVMLFLFQTQNTTTTALDQSELINICSHTVQIFFWAQQEIHYWMDQLQLNLATSKLLMIALQLLLGFGLIAMIGAALEVIKLLATWSIVDLHSLTIQWLRLSSLFKVSQHYTYSIQTLLRYHRHRIFYLQHS